MINEPDLHNGEAPTSPDSALARPPGELAFPVSATGRWVSIRPVLPPDYPLLYGWSADLRDLYLWSHDRRVLIYQDFVARLEQALRDSQSYVISDRRSSSPIGFCQGYNFNPVEGWISFLLYVTHEFRKQPHPAEAGLIFLDLLFKHFPLRKVYADVFEYNTDSHSLLVERGGFTEEARLPRHIWYEDRYWALIKLALYRENWEAVRSRLNGILQIQDEFNSAARRTRR